MIVIFVLSLFEIAVLCGLKSMCSCSMWVCQQTESLRMKPVTQLFVMLLFVLYIEYTAHQYKTIV